MSPEEWEKRRQEHARRQQELFRQEQERIELERRTKPKVLSQREAIVLFAEHDWQWERLKTLDDLGWDNFPWPVFEKPTEPEELTSVAINAYVLSSHHPTDKSKTARARIKNQIKKWHLDRFETTLLRKVREEEREKVREGARSVALTLNKMLACPNPNSLVAFDKVGRLGEEDYKNYVPPKRKEQPERKEEELRKLEAELERREAEVMAKEERLRQEEVNRLAREEEERRRVRKVFREVRDRGGVLV
jgi:hypothetical protein